MREPRRASMACVCQRVTRPPPRVAPTRAVNSKKMRARRLSRFHITLPKRFNSGCGQSVCRNGPAEYPKELIDLCYHKNKGITPALWDFPGASLKCRGGQWFCQEF